MGTAFFRIYFQLSCADRRAKAPGLLSLILMSPEYQLA